MADCRVLGAGLLLAVLGLPTSAANQPASLRQVVSAGQPAPGGGTLEPFTVEVQPVVAPATGKGEVAFFATLLRAPAAEGLFLASGSRVARVAVEGDRAPGGGILSGFGRHPIPSINAARSVAFAAAVSGGKTIEGIFVAS